MQSNVSVIYVDNMNATLNDTSYHMRKWQSYWANTFSIIILQYGAFSNTGISDFEHCGCKRHTCLPNASPNHVIHPIGWFKLVTNLRHHASLKPLF